MGRILFFFLLIVFLGCECHKTKTYYPDGTIEKEVCLKDGNYHGKLLLYHENGEVKSISHWKDGVQNGISISYYETGELKDSAYIVDGTPHGPFVQYYEDGKIKKSGKYDNGAFYGKHFYYKNGNISTINLVRNGSPVAYLEYDDKGELEDRWIIKKSIEEFFLDVNDDTLMVGDFFKAKIIINDKIADSVNVYLGEVDASELSKYTPAFSWPSDGSTRYNFKKESTKEGLHKFNGIVQVFFKNDLPSKEDAGKTEIIPFSVQYFIMADPQVSRS